MRVTVRTRGASSRWDGRRDMVGWSRCGCLGDLTGCLSAPEPVSERGIASRVRCERVEDERESGLVGLAEVGGYEGDGREVEVEVGDRTRGASSSPSKYL